MTKRALQIAASAFILLALGFIVIGLANDRLVVWGLGLVAVAIAMIMPFATRWIGSGPE